jgi:hypothetical protein
MCLRAVSQGSYRADVSQARLDYQRASAVMTALPDHRALVDLPSDLDALRWVVQASYCIVDWARAHGVAGEAILANPRCGSAHEPIPWST